MGTYAIIGYGLAIFLAIIAIKMLSVKQKVVAGVSRNWGWLILAVGIFGILLQYGAFASTGALGSLGLNLNSPLSIGDVSTNAGNSNSGSSSDTTVTTYQPTGTFSAKDTYSTQTITGTSYYKRDNYPASTTAISNTNPGELISYWVDNGTSAGYYFVNPVMSQPANSKVSTFLAQGYQNGTVSVTLYDSIGRAATTNGVTANVSMAANKQANIEITYQGTYKQSAMPFGGVLVIEANSSIATITCTGSDLLSSNPYHVTYNVASTSNKYLMYGVGPTIDTGAGDIHRINCQFNNGNTGTAGAAYYVNFIPANYYVSQAGNLVLDTEKNADGSVTRVGSNINTPHVLGYWS